MKVSDNKRWYWGYERLPAIPPLFEAGHLMVTDPPYIKGDGLRVRLGRGVFSMGRVRGLFARQLAVDLAALRDYQRPDDPQERMQRTTFRYLDNALIWEDPRDAHPAEARV